MGFMVTLGNKGCDCIVGCNGRLWLGNTVAHIGGGIVLINNYVRNTIIPFSPSEKNIFSVQELGTNKSADRQVDIQKLRRMGVEFFWN